MINGVIVPKPCRRHRIDRVVHRLKDVDIWVGPRYLGIGNMPDDMADEDVAEVRVNGSWKVFDPRVNL